MFFRPEIVDSKWNTSLVQMLDNTIQMSPVDCRRMLYKNIILSGGSTSVTGLHKRLEKELKDTVNNRMARYTQGKGTKPAPIEINIYSSPYQNFAVWNGGSMLACHVWTVLLRITSQTTTTSAKITSKLVPRLPDTILSLRWVEMVPKARKSNPLDLSALINAKSCIVGQAHILEIKCLGCIRALLTSSLGTLT